MTILAFTAKQILEIKVDSPHKLFDQETFEKQFRVLRGKWHPDRCKDPEADDVFDHIVKLHAAAEKQSANGTWKGKAVLTFTTDKNKTFKLRYLKHEPFELGNVYIGQQYVMYVFDKGNEDLASNGTKMLKLLSVKHPNPEMKKEFAKLFPTVVDEYATDIGYVVVLKKPETYVCMKDLVEYSGGKIDPKHCAWIVGCLTNLTVYYDFIGITHNSILPSTVYVDPINHSCMVIGGWWYSAKKGSKLKAVPSVLLKVLPKEILEDKIAVTKYDRLAAKRTCVYCLGDQSMTGSKLLMDSAIPKPMLNWLRQPATDDAIKDYKRWDEALLKSFGKREFIKMDIDITQIY